MEKLTAYLNRRINAVLGRGLLEDVIIDYIIVTEEANKTINTDGFILEAKVVFNQIPGVKHYTYRIDKQQGDGGPGRQRHIHIFYDGKELFALNADSTAHDGYHQVKIPDELVPFLTDKGFTVPDNHIIEMLVQIPSGETLICESLDYGALNRFASNVGEAILSARVVTIIESNVETYQVKSHSSVLGKYEHVNRLEEVPQCHIDEVREMLIYILKENGKFGETFKIFDDELTTPHRLFIAWND